MLHSTKRTLGKAAVRTTYHIEECSRNDISPHEHQIVSLFPSISVIVAGDEVMKSLRLFSTVLVGVLVWAEDPDGRCQRHQRLLDQWPVVIKGLVQSISSPSDPPFSTREVRLMVTSGMKLEAGSLMPGYHLKVHHQVSADEDRKKANDGATWASPQQPPTNLRPQEKYVFS